MINGDNSGDTRAACASSDGRRPISQMTVRMRKGLLNLEEIKRIYMRDRQDKKS